MQVSRAFRGREPAIAAMFDAAFTASDGPQEGRAVGQLVTRLLTQTAPADLHVFLAEQDETIVAGAIFTRLTFAGDKRSVFILSPMAVASDLQGAGLGSGLLRHALTSLREAGIEIAVTYGDPAFYGRLGFMPMSEAEIPAPLPLSHPHGWVGQCLDGRALPVLSGPCTCVPALNDPSIW